MVNIDIDLIRQPEGLNWPTVGGVNPVGTKSQSLQKKLRLLLTSRNLNVIVHYLRTKSNFSRKISVEEEKKTSTCSKIFSWIKLFFAHLFGHIGLTALVVSFLPTFQTVFT